MAHFQQMAARSEIVAGQNIRELITVNGVRVVLHDGTWGLVRASSNKPELVIVCESPTSEENMKAMFKNIDMHLSSTKKSASTTRKSREFSGLPGTRRRRCPSGRTLNLSELHFRAQAESASVRDAPDRFPTIR